MKCETCKGSGYLSSPPIESGKTAWDTGICHDCNGTGKKQSTSDEIREAFKEDSPYFYEELLKHPDYHQTEYSLYEQAWIRAQQKSQAELEAWKKTVPTFQTIHDNLQNRIKELEAEIEGLKQSEENQQRLFIRLQKHIYDMKCCGNCDQENLQSGCLISEADIIRHEYICENWQFKGKK